MLEKTKVKRRKRGVKASRIKLEKALINAGFKTQSALAKHIAEIENTDTIPKDIVNRVFREVSVSPHTLERIANALDVEAYTLYLSSNDVQSPSSPNNETIDTHEDINQISTNKWLKKHTYLMIFLLVGGVSFFFIWQGEISEKTTKHEDTLLTLRKLIPSLGAPIGKYALALRASPPLTAITEELKVLLKKDFNLVPTVYMQDENTIETQNIEQESQVDFIINLQLIELGRFWLIESSLIKYPTKIILTRKLLTKSEFLSNNHQYSQKLVDTINTFIDKGFTKLPNDILPDLSYLTLVGEGMSLLDQSNDLNKVKQAKNKFLLAKDIDETLPLAKAGLCLSYLYESWSGDEKTLLSRASQHCQAAKITSNKNALVSAANGFLLRRTGRLDQAHSYINKQLVDTPNSVDLLIEKANILLELFRQSTGDDNLLIQAKKSLQQASSIEPMLWKSYFYLGTVEWYYGDKQAAIKATSIAAKLNANDLVLGNMVSFSLCNGDLESAKSYLSQTLHKQPHSYVGLEQMSMLSYFSHNFQSAIDYRLKSIANVGESTIHEMWGALADAYHFNGNTKLSLQTYNKALQMINREYARGNQTKSHQAFRLYYQIKKHLLNGKKYPLDGTKNALLSIAEQHNALDSSAVARIALGFHYLGEKVYAQKFQQLASERCPIYLKLPDW